MVSIWCFVKNVRGFRVASSLVVVVVVDVVAAGGMPNSTLTAFVFSVVYPATSARPVRINDRTWQAHHHHHRRRPRRPRSPGTLYYTFVGGDENSFKNDTRFQPPSFPAVGLSVSFWPPQAVCSVSEEIKRVKNRSSALPLHRPYAGNVNRCSDDRIHRTRRRHAELCRDLNRLFEYLPR